MPAQAGIFQHKIKIATFVAMTKILKEEQNNYLFLPEIIYGWLWVSLCLGLLYYFLLQLF